MYHIRKPHQLLYGGRHYEKYRVYYDPQIIDVEEPLIVEGLIEVNDKTISFSSEDLPDMYLAIKIMSIFTDVDQLTEVDDITVEDNGHITIRKGDTVIFTIVDVQNHIEQDSIEIDQSILSYLSKIVYQWSETYYNRQFSVDKDEKLRELEEYFSFRIEEIE